MTTDGPPQGPDAVPPPLPQPGTPQPPYGSEAAYPVPPSHPVQAAHPGQPAYPGQQYGAQPGYGAPGGFVPGPAPDNHLVWAILSTVLCCLPLGIVSIVYAAQVNDKWLRGDAAGAMESSRKAKQFAMWGAIVHVVLLAVVAVVYIGFFAVLIGTGVSTAP